MPLIARKDTYLINRLIGYAFAYPEICKRLLAHDETLMQEFVLSEYTWLLIKEIKATSLREFCQQLVSRHPNFISTEAE
jgi:hypothetical protein